MKDSNVLVIGGAGFIGANLCKKLIDSNVRKITILDNLLSSTISNVLSDKRVQFIYGSASCDRDLQALDDAYDYIFHLGTYHGNQSSMHNPLKDHENNTLPTLKLCEFFKKNNHIKKFVYASAGCTVAEKTFKKALATDEKATISAYLDSPYQISKIVGEFYGNYYWKQYNLPFVKARFQNVYGPREILGAGEWRGTSATVWRNVIPTFIWKALYGEKLPIDNGGIATRDFIYVDDLIDGLILCALDGKEGEIYNLASGVETSIKELALLINKYANNSAGLAIQPAREWDHSGCRYGDTTKSKCELNFAAKTNLACGLTHTIDWVKENADLIRMNILRHAYYMPELNLYHCEFNHV